MTAKRKHVLVVEMTTSHPLTERWARNALSLLLARLECDAEPIFASRPGNYAEKFTVKSFSRVLSAAKRKDKDA